MIARAEARLDQTAQIGQRPARYAVALQVGAVEHERLQLHLLRRRQLALRAALRPVVKPRQPLRVVANDRIAQRLALHPGQAGRLRPPQPFKRSRDRVRPRRRPAPRLPARPSAKIRRRQIIPYLECNHRLSPNIWWKDNESHPDSPGNPQSHLMRDLVL